MNSSFYSTSIALQGVNGRVPLAARLQVEDLLPSHAHAPSYLRLSQLLPSANAYQLI